MSGAGLRGVSAEQDGRFRNKEARLLKQMKFPEEFQTKVDLGRVNWDVMKPWIAKRVTELLGIEDDVLIGYIFGQLEGLRSIDPRKLQINLTGFLEKNTSLFCKELWTLLISAAASGTGIPQRFLDEKAEELRRRREEEEQIQAKLRAEQARRAEERREEAAASRRDEGRQPYDSRVGRDSHQRDYPGDRREEHRPSRRRRSPSRERERSRDRHGRRRRRSGSRDRHRRGRSDERRERRREARRSRSREVRGAEEQRPSHGTARSGASPSPTPAPAPPLPSHD